eukprot:12538061-Heterocapsa_arctica.AAC.1
MASGGGWLDSSVSARCDNEDWIVVRADVVIGTAELVVVGAAEVIEDAIRIRRGSATNDLRGSATRDWR